MHNIPLLKFFMLQAEVFAGKMEKNIQQRSGLFHGKLFKRDFHG